MKKYSAEDFEKKFKTLRDKLLIKQGFEDQIQESRKKLGVPTENGFSSSLELAIFLAEKLSSEEILNTAFISFISNWERRNTKRAEEGDREIVLKELDDFISDKPENIQFLAIKFLEESVEDHNELFTLQPIIRQDFKEIAKLGSEEFKIFNKYFRPDLLDEFTILHFVEKYLFLGDAGVAGYIRKRVSCSHCKNIGVLHFSPSGDDMEGQNEGIGSKNYVFNKSFVKRISQHFNSVFLIIKPYATKPQVIQYIEENWDDLKDHMNNKNTFYKQYNVGSTRIRTSDFDRNRIIYELYQLPKKELLKKYNGEKNFSLPGIYKQTVVSAILEEQHDIKMTPEAVKRAATRYANATKVIDEPRDIGDI